MGSAICGGVISETMYKKDVEKYGIWADLMCYVMPDVEYDKYIKLIEADEHKEASKLFKKYAYSLI